MKRGGVFPLTSFLPLPEIFQELAGEMAKSEKRFYRAVTLTMASVIFFLLHGCSTMSTIFTGEQLKYTRTFSAGYDDVWAATMDALAGVSIKKANDEAGKLETEWVEERPMQKGTGLLVDTYWVERYRFIISTSRESEMVTRLSVLCLVQEKTKGGARSFNWVRKKSSGEREQQLLDKIDEILTGK